MLLATKWGTYTNAADDLREIIPSIISLENQERLFLVTKFGVCRSRDWRSKGYYHSGCPNC